MCRKHLARLLIAIAAIASLQSLFSPDLAAAPREEFEGIVASVSRDELTVGDDRRALEGRFTVRQNTKIMRDGKLARFRDIQPGDMVTVTARPLGDKLLALTITAMTPR